MIDKLIAYDLKELENRKVIADSRDLYKSRFLSQEQWQQIQTTFVCKLYTPSFFMKILFFILAIIGMFTIMGPFALALGDIGIGGYRFLSLILGSVILFFTEKVLIREKNHYKSGITEAGMFAGLSFIAFATMGFESENVIMYLIGGLVLSLVAAVRYLNLVGLVLGLFFFGWILFYTSMEAGGLIQALLPFTFMAAFALVYFLSRWGEAKIDNIVFDNQFILSQAIALLMFYMAGNYFVVRELSVNLMDLSLLDGQDIPFAFMFYIFTAAIPFAYLYWGIRHRSLLFLRVGLLTIALSVITLKYYFSLGMPVVTITISGALLIGIALGVMKYLKQPRSGFTRELIFKDKWMTNDVTGFVASQTLGGNKAGLSGDGDQLMQGGKFGGGGAGNNW
jgi:hypothetical protein